ncbi:hypothetical protein HD806DRAFT_392550 [Xylariaceae sp. AK1471]|nr:hypothetical protein HD806DRAFT_392550 [Xylariaceae sp. AK1471]
MFDPRDELETLSKGRRITFMCAEELETIRVTCIREHGKSHPVECPECWSRLVNRLRDRYLNSSIKEWLSGRRAFLQELDYLFAKAHKHEVDLKTIEKRIADEKEVWFRDKVRNLGLQTATKSPTDARTLQQILDDRDIPSDQLVSELRKWLGVDTELSKEMFKAFSKQNKEETPTAKAQVWISALFQPQHDPAGAAKSLKYIDMLTDGKPVVDVISAMVRDRQSSKVDTDQKQKLEKKLEELRRAKAAHDLAKAKRDQVRQEKARAAMASENAYNLPPCSVCNKAVDAQNFIACPLCQLPADLYKVLKEPTVFCSETCHDEGYGSHLEVSHECLSGANCLSLRDAEDRMEVDESTLVFCRECAEDYGQESIFCSSRCLDVNFQRHRDDVHIPERERRYHEVEEEGQVEFDPEDETRYPVRRGEERIIGLRDAVADWQQRTGARVS